MRKDRIPLDQYDRLPPDMENYLRYNGWHFNKHLCNWAVRQMRKKGKDDKEEKLEPWTKDKVEDLLSKNNVKLEHGEDYDHVYVANMVRADLPKSVSNDEKLAMFVKEYVEDIDQADGFIMARFYYDCVRKGLGIPWSDVL